MALDGLKLLNIITRKQHKTKKNKDGRDNKPGWKQRKRSRGLQATLARGLHEELGLQAL